ncbi:MAG: molybdopterin-dependent oxidoreductase [Myxococcota bacterium]|nr:molybdopterin-dependent oxidoreductase [Myxococcota bacterium]
MSKQLRTICNRDCPDSCSILAEVENGRIVKQRGDRAHGITRGFLCKRGNQYLDRFYSPNRVLHPLRRKPSGVWERITWDDALDLAAEKLRYHMSLDGPESILAITYSGIKGLVAKSKWHIFWSTLGVTGVKGGLSAEAVHAGQALDFGGDCAHTMEDFENAAGFVIWGKNIAITYPHSIPFVKVARKKGAPMVVIDPVACKTAKQADQHLQLVPGSDGMLALGIARQLIKRGAVDQAFIDAHTVGFEQFAELTRAIEPDAVLRATGLTRDQVEALTDLYATCKPLCTMAGLGIGYWRHGSATIRLIDALAAMTGNIGIPGGGVFTDTSASDGLDLRDLSHPYPRKLRLPRLGEEILAAHAPPIKAAWIAGANPAATAPDTNRLDQALSGLDFLVVVDQFQTASSNHAHLFLPCTTYLEMDDLVRAYGHHWLGMCQQVVEPLGEARSDSQILEQMADRLGFGQALAGSTASWTSKLLGALTARGVTPERLAQGPTPNPMRHPVAFADKRFKTESGKFEFVTDYPCRPKEVGLDGSLRLMATKTIHMVNAQINERDLRDEALVRAHPQTLLEQGLLNEQRVLVKSSVGSVQARIFADETVLQDVLLFNPAAWRGDLQGVNQLRESIMTDLGNAAAMHETQIKLETVAG